MFLPKIDVRRIDVKKTNQRHRECWRSYFCGDTGVKLAIIFQRTSGQILALLVLLSLGFAPAQAREVKVDYQGFDLIGELDLASRKTLRKHGVIIVLHDVMSHFNEPPVLELRTALVERGFNVLAINLSLGLDGRKGPYDCKVEQDHRYTDALPEIHAWVKWLRTQKTSNITLLGVGLGANQVALYGGKTSQKSVRSIILVGPANNSKERAHLQYQRLYGKSLRDVLFDVQVKISGQQGELLENTAFLKCQNARVSTNSFLSYYGDKRQAALAPLITGLKKPTLVIAGELGEESENLLAALQQLEARPNLRLDIIEAADERFSGGSITQVVERIKVFKDEAKGK